MDKINSVIKMLFASSVVILILDAFLPSDKFKAYLRMFSGAVMVLTVVRMLSGISSDELKEIIPLSIPEISYTQESSVNAGIRRFNEEKLKKLAGDTALSVLKRECTVRIYEVSDNNYRIYISSSSCITEDEKAEISAAIHERSGLEEENIIFFVSNER